MAAAEGLSMRHVFDQQARERQDARAMYASADRSLRGEICDALVLGCFDWRDYFDAKPSSAWLDEFLTCEQRDEP